MALHLIQDIITLAFAIPVLVTLMYWYFSRSNKNSRRDLALANIGAVFFVVVSAAYYLTGVDNRALVDGQLVQWERPLFTAAIVLPTMIAAGLFLAVDYHATLLFLSFAIASLTAWEFGTLGGSLANMKTDGWWFLWGLTGTLFLLVSQAAFMMRDRDRRGWAVISLGIVASIFYGAAWLLGPEFTQSFGNNTQAWIALPADVLFVLMNLGMSVMQGEEDSIWNKAKQVLKERRMNGDA
jgi:hypothetical protein